MKKMASKESKRHIDAGESKFISLQFSLKFKCISSFPCKNFIEQTDTVEEHYAYIMSNEELIDSEFTEVTSNDLPDWYDPELFKRYVRSIN